MDKGASITLPATLSAYEISLAEVADLSQGLDPDIWDNAWKEWACGRQIARIDKTAPPSWKLADMVITVGLRGILFPHCVTRAEQISWSSRSILSTATRS